MLKKEDLRIVFMGTPEFAVETLRALVENGYRVVAVVTQPDKPVGRHGSVLQPSAVKQYALEVGLPVLQPEKMKDEAFLEQLRAYQANLQVVVAFRMLPEVVWAMPKYGTFNVHAALLPQYRGAAPINWAVINGETQTGVTTFFLDQDIDTGRIIMQLPFDIPDDADAAYVYDGLMHLGADICLQTLERIVAADGCPESYDQLRIENGELTIQNTIAGKQINEESNHNSQFPILNSPLHSAPKIYKDTCLIDWSMTAKQVYDFVRGLSPYPGAWTNLCGQDGKEVVLKLFRTSKTDLPSEGRNGQVIVYKKHLYIGCDDRLLQIDELQLAGKNRMDAQAFLNGMKDLDGCRCY